MPQMRLDSEAVGRRVVGDVAPDEIPYFDAAATQFRRAPCRAPVTDVDDQLGFGVGIAAVCFVMLYPLAFAAGSFMLRRRERAHSTP